MCVCVCAYVTCAHMFVCVTVCHTSMRVLMPVDTPGGQKKALGVVGHNSPPVSEAGSLSEPRSVSASPSNHPVSASLKVWALRIGGEHQACSLGVGVPSPHDFTSRS